ncbi:hypothetical protein GGI25_002709 [Coemansia spiralis]|uniref:Dilute domain-containing protein n=1 Tax=Coemansia spiralis TaxID=417178 RepID=A0A9W8G3J4_9FUNG|nr:hypothetical protein GGI25_002709 [Coemansia spiralis]
MSSIEQVNYDNIASDEFLSETDIIESAELSDNKRRDLLSQRFARTASSGDAAALERMWKTCQGSQWVDIDYRDDQGSTPLICASCFGHTRIGELLLKYGANVDTQDNSGWTALMWATTNQNEDLVRVLLENGASSSAKTARGHTAINIASSSLSAGSDSESFQRAFDSPPPESDATDLGDDHHNLPGCANSEADLARNGGLDGDIGVAAGSSPRSTDHSIAGTPGRRTNGRDSITAGQSVLSMLQASSARSSVSKRADNSASRSPTSEPRLASSPPHSTDSSGYAISSGLGLAFNGSEHAENRALGLPHDGSLDYSGGSSSLAGRLRTLAVDGGNSTGRSLSRKNNGRSRSTTSSASSTDNSGSVRDGADGNTKGTADYDDYDYNGENNNNIIDGEDDGETKEPQVFNWDTLSLDQMYVISPAAVPQFLHAVVKDIRPEQWIHSKVVPEYKFVPASMIFLAARFAHYLDMPDFLESFIADAIASIIHEVQTHKSDPVALAFWIANIQTLIYFFKRDSTLVQSTSDAQGRMSECIQDAYSLLIRAVEAEIEPLIDVSMLAYESMPELFADVKFEAERSQRLSMFFFGNQADITRKSSDGRPLRRSQTILQKGGGRPRRSSILGVATQKSAVSGPATANGESPAWVLCVEQLQRGILPTASVSGKTGNANEGGHRLSSVAKRPSSGDTFVSGRLSQDTRRQSTSIFNLVSSPSPRTITYVLECLLDVLEMCEIHPHVVWSIMRQLFCYLGSEMFNRVLTTRDFCSRSRAMQIRMNLTQLSDWVRTNSNRIPVPSTANSIGEAQESNPGVAGAEGQPLSPKMGGAQSAESLLYKVYFSPLVELLELLQCLTHLPDLPEYFETTAKMQSLNILQQETAVANYRYEVQERKISAEVVEYLESVAKEIRDGQRAEREKQNIEKASRRSTASVFTERRTLDGRPNLLSFDLASSGSRGASGGGLVRIAAAANDVQGAPAIGANTEWNTHGERAAAMPSVSRDGIHQPIPLSRLSAESAGRPSQQSLSQASGGVVVAAAAAGAGAAGAGGSRINRTSTRSGRRGLLLPLARPGTNASAKPSARTLFPTSSAASGSGPSPTGQSNGGRSSSTHSRLSESLEPITETASNISRQRSRTTIDSTDDIASSGIGNGASSNGGGDDLANGSNSSAGMTTFNSRPSEDSFAYQTAQPPNTAPAVNNGNWGYDEQMLTASLRGPKGKKCLPENMNELLDSTEMLPFAVPTSREWQQWWQSQSAKKAATSAGDGRSHNREWSNDTVAYHASKSSDQMHQQKLLHNAEPSDNTKMDAGTAGIEGASQGFRSELAPAVPSDFLSTLLQSV